MPRKQKEPKPKQINYHLITTGERPEMYDMLFDLVNQYHGHLADAKIALAWRYSLKADKDGRLVLGKCQKASDLSRELVEWDFIILLNFEWWSSREVSDEQRRALMDHELCHAAIATDQHGESRFDDRGRLVYRVRKHDLEEFREIVERHGLYKADLEEFARAIQARKRTQLRELAEPLLKVANS